MNKKTCVFFLSVLLSIFCLGGCLPTNAVATDTVTTDSLENAVATNSLEIANVPKEIPEPLLSWNEISDDGTGSKEAIIAFVDQVTNRESDYYVEPEDRIAVFDNDGTLWAERPQYFQGDFLKNESENQSHVQLSQLPKITQKQLDRNKDGKIDSPEIKSVLDEIAVFEDITTDEYIALARDFVYDTTQSDLSFPDDDNPAFTRFNAKYIDLTYKPVIELVNYLKANGFKVYICSGGGVDFVRSFAEDAYGIAPQKVIGSAIKTKFEEEDGSRAYLVRTPILGQYNDKQGKPVGIERHIGKRPIIAVGNSSGDLEMFLYTDNGTVDDTDSLIVLINHDDCQREYQYNDGSGTANDGENLSLDEANTHDNWIVVSMKDDFSDIFYDPQPSRPAPSCPQE